MFGRRFWLVGSIVLACGTLALSASGGSAATFRAVGSGAAVEAAGVVTSISCAAAGDCVAGGYYLEGHVGYLRLRGYTGYTQTYRRGAFVVSETNGRWGRPFRVHLPVVGDAEVDSISCSAIGDCAAGGYFTGPFAGGGQAFVVSEKNGKWSDAVEVPGTAALNTSGYAGVTSISCAAPGECAAGGYYAGRHFNEQAFVASETHGVWHKAIEVPGTAALNTGGYGEVNSISCAAVGECAVGGSYTHGRKSQAFVASEAHGIWGSAIEVPGTGTLNVGGRADVSSISCSAGGECAAVGSYSDTSTTRQAFVVVETNHTWGGAFEVPGTATLNTKGNADAATISCPATGECAAGGYITEGRATRRAFVVAETGGAWGNAIEVPGITTLSRDSGVDSISCAAPGECAASGDYKQPRADSGGLHGAAFVAGEVGGTWGNAIEVPGTLSLNGSASPAATADSVSCAAPGNCAAGGYWWTGGSDLQPRYRRPRAFVLDEQIGTWGAPVRIRNHAIRCEVPSVLFRTIQIAKIRLTGFGCRLGTITRARSSVWKGLVIAQQPSLGKTLPAGARVAVSVSRGQKP